MWRQGDVLQDFKYATIVYFYKRKGNRQFCDNHQDILLNVVGKIFARILLNRLNRHLEQGLLPESQCGFRRHSGTTDIIFAARQLQKECQEMQTHLHFTFVDPASLFATNLRHLRHAEAAETALKRPPRVDERRAATKTTLLRRCRHWFPPTRRPSLPIQGHYEDFSEASADEPGQLGRPGRDRPTWKRTVKTGAANYEANRITAVKLKREALKSQLRPLNVNAQPPPTCPRCQRTSPTPIGLVGYLRTNCNTRGYTNCCVLVQLRLILRADD
ncbi:hypothetical protein SprV_0100367900 [Sparganum proliferum]